MDQLSNFLKIEISKFRDIEHIYAKLEHDGQIEAMYALFGGLFQHESEFTINELMKIEKEKGEKINIREQYKNNLSLFKSNLLLIVQLIIESSFKAIVTENNKVLKDMRHDHLQLPENQPHGDLGDELQEKPEEALIIRKSPVNSASKKKPAMGINVSATNNNQPMISPSSISQSSKRSSTKQLSAQKVPSPLNQVLNSSPRSQFRTDSGTKVIQKDLSSSGLKKTGDFNTSYYSNRSPNDRSVLSVQSEFNHIKGSATFTQSTSRYKWEQGESPGPAQYYPEKSSPANLKRSPSPTMGRAPKASWIDQVSKTEGPGPAFYPSMHFIKK